VYFHVFLDHIFIKKMRFFSLTPLLWKSMVFGGLGRFWRCQEPTKTSKSEVWTLPKRYREKTRKLMVFQKTEWTAEPSETMLFLTEKHGFWKMHITKNQKISSFQEVKHLSFLRFWAHFGRPKVMKIMTFSQHEKHEKKHARHNKSELWGGPETAKTRIEKHRKI